MRLRAIPSTDRYDWDDDRSTAILRNVRNAMGNTRLLVIERVIPTGDDPFIGKQVEISRLTTTGGQERTEKEYRRLLATVCVKLGRVLSNLGASSVLEAFPE